jgi:hypothetical protein
VHTIILILLTLQAAAQDAWTLPVYNHYRISLERVLTNTDTPSYLVYHFDCLRGNPNHTRILRRRDRTSYGTVTSLRLDTRV